MSQYWWRIDEPTSLLGTWWIWKKKRNMIPGELVYTPGKGLELRRNSNFVDHESLRDLFRAFSEPSEAYTIHGVVGGNTPVTLKECFPSREAIVVNAAFIGIHCNPIRPPRVNSLVIKLSNLEAWLGGIKTEGDLTDKLRLEVRPGKLEKSVEGTLHALNAHLEIQHGVHSRYEASGVQLSHQAEIRFKFNSLVAFDVAQRAANLTMQLLALLIGKPTTLTLEWYRFENDAAVSHLAPSWVRLAPRKLHPAEILCSMKTIQSDFVELLDRWIERAKRLETPRSLLHAVLMKSATFLDSEVTELMQAIEGYCNETDSFAYLSDEQFANVLSKINSASEGTTADFVDRVANSAKWFNRPSLRSHLKRLLSRIDPDVAKNIVGRVGIPKFVGQCVVARNKIAHPQSGSIWEDHELDDVMELISRLKLLLVTCMLLDAGMTVETIRAKYRDHRRWQWG